MMPITFTRHPGGRNAAQSKPECHFVQRAVLTMPRRPLKNSKDNFTTGGQKYIMEPSALEAAL